MGFDMSHRFIHLPVGERPPHQPPASTNPWTNPQTNPQPSNPSTQQSNAWNPWTNPPTTAPSANTSHRHVYQPVPSSVAEPNQQPGARDPWTNLPAPTPSFSFPSNWSHEIVYKPSFADSVRPYHQSATSSLWTEPTFKPVPLFTLSYSVLRLSQSSTLPSIELTSFWQTSPAPMYYPGGSPSPQIQFYSSQPAAEPANFNTYQGLTAQQVNDRNISRAQNHGGFDQVQLIPQTASPDNQYYCRELDGTWTLRTVDTIMNHLNPGQWAYGAAGHPYWIRHSKD